MTFTSEGNQLVFTSNVVLVDAPEELHVDLALVWQLIHVHVVNVFEPELELFAAS